MRRNLLTQHATTKVCEWLSEQTGQFYQLLTEVPKVFRQTFFTYNNHCERDLVVLISTS